jgi:hypothetical protein
MLGHDGARIKAALANGFDRPKIYGGHFAFDGNSKDKLLK